MGSCGRSTENKKQGMSQAAKEELLLFESVAITVARIISGHKGGRCCLGVSSSLAKPVGSSSLTSSGSHQ